MQVIQGGRPEEQGTFIHPNLAVRFGIWLSDEFGYMIEGWVEQWITFQNPHFIALSAKITKLEQKLSSQDDAISTLQTQVQNLLPPDSSTPPLLLEPRGMAATTTTGQTPFPVSLPSAAVSPVESGY